MGLFKRILSNTWVVGILCSIIATGIVSVVTSVHKEINIVQAVILVLKTLWCWVLAVLTFKVPMYAILIAIIGLIFGLKILASYSSSKQNNSPQWLKYKKAPYKSWIFTWEYQIDIFSKTYEIEHLRPICQCGCALSCIGDLYYDNMRLSCPKCGQQYPPISEYDISDFKKVLIHDIQNDLYAKDTIKS